MARVKRGVQAKARHKKVLKQAKGFRGARSRTYKVAKQAVMKAGQYAYTEIGELKKEYLGHCGSLELMLQQEITVLHTVN